MASPALLVLLLLLLAAGDYAAAALRFDYATLTLGSLRLLGDAHLKNGTIRLSRDLPVPNSGSGRALYATPVPLRQGFSTQFAFTVATLNTDSVGGGLALVVARDGTTLGDAGPYIGVSAASDVAVEFDTLMDVQFGDVNGNHVGLDLGSMVSAAVADLDGAGVELTSGRTVNAWIEYSGKGLMEVFVSYSPKRPPEPVLSAPLDLGEYVKDEAFVGFSASTQGSTEMHAVECLHGEGHVLDAVDARLGGDYDEGEMRRALLVGLACSSPEPALRPGMRAVVQMLSGEADPPFVPATRPSMSFSANHHLLLSLQDSVSDYNALGLNELSDDSSSDSLSSSSLTSTLRKGGHDIGFSSTAGDAAR
uniref:Legume lectin domain-containing protein n=1 Tax=Oryza brachyantha TaxID=4533 RepID=J3M3K7_ORYBR